MEKATEYLFKSLLGLGVGTGIAYVVKVFSLAGSFGNLISAAGVMSGLAIWLKATGEYFKKE